MNEYNPPKWKRFAILAAALVGLPLAMAATDRILEGKYLRSIPGGGLITVPNTTDTMVTRTATETLSNKTIIGSANTIWANRLLTDPSACGGGQFVTDIAADGTLTCNTPAGSGDVTGPAASVDNELVLFSGTGGKTIKRASGNGAVSVVSGVVTQGTLGVSTGGTGATTLTTGSIVIGQGTSAVSQLVVPASGYFVASDGTEWTTKQTLGVANGGTGANSITSNAIIIGQGSSAVSQLAVPASGYFVKSNGTAWTTGTLSHVYAVYVNNGGTVVTANVTNIDWSTKVQDTNNAWSGTTFTAPKASFYIFNGVQSYTASIGGVTDMYVNGVIVASQVDSISNSTTFPFSFGWYLNASDTVNFRSQASGTLSTTSGATRHWISIMSQ